LKPQEVTGVKTLCSCANTCIVKTI